MARLGVLNPLRGTESSLANVVLDEGELAFSYPTTGPGTGLGGIKMGDGVKTFSSLPWYITGEGSGPTPDPWQYDEGTDEDALLNNIIHPEYETIGKIYYITSYWWNGSSCIVTIGVPYKVIGINHDGTNNTVDLKSMVFVNQITWYNGYSSWSYGKYSTSGLYSWVSDTCPLGYSANIQAKMCYMIERWREATGDSSGTLQTRQTKCKLLNPYELSGNSILNYGGSEDFVTYNYGEFYSNAFRNTIDIDDYKLVYTDLAMSSNDSMHWTNSYYAMVQNQACLFMVDCREECKGKILRQLPNNLYHISPVIRLSNPS